MRFSFGNNQPLFDYNNSTIYSNVIWPHALNLAKECSVGLVTINGPNKDILMKHDQHFAGEVLLQYIPKHKGREKILCRQFPGKDFADKKCYAWPWIYGQAFILIPLDQIISCPQLNNAISALCPRVDFGLSQLIWKAKMEQKKLPKCIPLLCFVEF